MEDSELRAGISLNVAVPANEGRLRKHLSGVSAVEALEFLTAHKSSERWLSLAADRAKSRLDSFDLEASLAMAERLGIRVVCGDEVPGMKDLQWQAPWVLFSSAEIPKVEYLAVVGTRVCSDEGERIAREIVSGFTGSEGLVSGGANGIDLVAHTKARENSTPQMVVLAGGMDSVFPKKAADFIRSGFFGAVISEMPPGVRSGKLGYLNRNRLIAAICKKLFLVEAPVVSGSINTAQHALSLGREVTTCLNKQTDFSPGGQWLSKKENVLTSIF